MANPNGRPRGVPNRQSRILQGLVEEKGGLSPGRVLLETMWFHYARAAEAQTKLANVAPADIASRTTLQTEVGRHLENARVAAKDVAPYIHTRLASVIVQGDADGGPVRTNVTGLVGLVPFTQADLARLSDGELASLYREAVSTPPADTAKPEPDPD